MTKTIRVGSMQMTVRQYADGRFGFDYTPPGEMRRQIRARTVERAEEKARAVLGAALGGRVSHLAIDPAEYAEFLRWKAERCRPALIADLVPQFLESKKNKGVSPVSLNPIRSILTRFAKQFPGPIAEVERKPFEKWLDGMSISNRTWNNIHGVVVQLYRWARRDALLPAELTAIERADKRKFSVSVTTYTPDELRALLTAARNVEPDWLPLLVIGAFAGLRPQELRPRAVESYKPGLRWENILWDKDKIDIPETVSKVRRRRFAPLLPVLREWLDPFRGRTGEVIPLGNPSLRHRRWQEASGVDWRADALRHSFASYRLALVPDMASLALEMGNSPNMIFRHYLDLQFKESAEKWFAVRP